MKKFSFKPGDVIIVDAERAKKEIMYFGPAIVTVNGPISLGFKETSYGIAEEYVLGLATPLMRELA